MTDESDAITGYLLAWEQGDRAAFDRVCDLVYRQLHRLARNQMRRERADHTLSSTALVHEAFVKLIRHRAIQWRSREQFFAVAARVMRQVLIDHGRLRAVGKRAGVRVCLDDIDPGAEPPFRASALADALRYLEKVDPRLGQLVGLRYIEGLAIGECAAALGLSHSTIYTELEAARGLLFHYLNGATP